MGFRMTVEPVEALGQSLGYQTSVPILPGHGTDAYDLNHRRWREWYAASEQALEVLAAENGPCVVVGHSMGALVGFRLAARRPDLVAAVVAVAPAFRLMDHFGRNAAFYRFLLPYWKGRTEWSDPAMRGVQASYTTTPMRGVAELVRLSRVVWPDLPRVVQPTRFQLGADDPVVDNEAAERAFALVGSRDKKISRYAGSAHQVHLDGGGKQALSDLSVFLTLMRTGPLYRGASPSV